MVHAGDASAPILSAAFPVPTRGAAAGQQLALASGSALRAVFETVALTGPDGTLLSSVTAAAGAGAGMQSRV